MNNNKHRYAEEVVTKNGFAFDLSNALQRVPSSYAQHFIDGDTVDARIVQTLHQKMESVAAHVFNEVAQAYGTEPFVGIGEKMMLDYLVYAPYIGDDALVFDIRPDDLRQALTLTLADYYDPHNDLYAGGGIVYDDKHQEITNVYEKDFALRHQGDIDIMERYPSHGIDIVDKALGTVEQKKAAPDRVPVKKDLRKKDVEQKKEETQMIKKSAEDAHKEQEKKLIDLKKRQKESQKIQEEEVRLAQDTKKLTALKQQHTKIQKELRRQQKIIEQEQAQLKVDVAQEDKPQTPQITKREPLQAKDSLRHMAEDEHGQGLSSQERLLRALTRESPVKRSVRRDLEPQDAHERISATTPQAHLDIVMKKIDQAYLDNVLVDFNQADLAILTQTVPGHYTRGGIIVDVVTVAGGQEAYKITYIVNDPAGVTRGVIDVARMDNKFKKVSEAYHS